MLHLTLEQGFTKSDTVSLPDKAWSARLVLLNYWMWDHDNVIAIDT